MASILFAYFSIYVVSAQTALAWRTIAHRGLFRDVNDKYALAENTVGAMQRAAQFGLPGVELDIQMTRDGVPVVAHETSREMNIDGLSGLVYPTDVPPEDRTTPQKRFKFSALPYWFWNRRTLKIYGRGGRIIRNAVSQKLESLEEMLGHLKALQKPEFRLFLDIQSPDAFGASAALVKKHRVEQQVLLKFFVNRAIDSSKYQYNGSETCSHLAQHEGFEGLQIVPQFNNGEIIIANGEAFLEVLHTRLSIPQYLDCCYTTHNSTIIQIPMVATSVPRSSPEHVPFIDAAVEALRCASSHGLQMMAIGPKLPVGRYSAEQCTVHKLAIDKMRVKISDRKLRDAKLYFAWRMLRTDDFLIGDVVGDVENHRWITDIGFLRRESC